MTNPLFTGVFTAIITPFTEDGAVDLEALKKIIDFNIANGVSGIVPCGTTGESPTLSESEAEDVIKTTVDHVNGRVKVIAGSGTNSTAKTIEKSKKAAELGVDALLVVNPYYNKPTQEGLYRHFKAVADSVDVPVVVYNIKGRTGVNVETDTLMRLVADCENIKAVKEASGDIEQMKAVIAATKEIEGFSVLSGDDGITLDLIKEGGHGVISVASNAIPGKMSLLVKAGLEGDFATADELNVELKDFFTKEFVETNPIPIKYIMTKMGYCHEVYRLPMCEMGEDNKKVVDALISSMGL